ncbi:MAG: DUF1501 domain-containing protein [Isosphaeraceae bacterium]
MTTGRADRRGCADFRETLRTGRRAFLRAGLLGASGFGLADLIRAEARGGAASGGRGAAVVDPPLDGGGPSHIDMWDPKPDAPEQVRGEFGTIPTKVPGVFLGDLLPMSAAMMDRWSIVRSLTHTDPGHSTADQLCFTGYPPGPDADANVKPSLGAVASRQLGPAVPGIPPYVMIPKVVPGAGSAYLGSACAPFETLADPAAPGPFRMPELSPPPGVSVRRLADRRALRDGLDRLRRETDRANRSANFDASYAGAWDVLTSSRAAEAFDIDREPAKVRERYGMTPKFDPGAANRCGAPNWAQRMLLARRLIEAGVRVVTVDVRWWDTHVLGFDSLRRGFLPRWDRAYTALIEDLDARGLLESTLVVAWGEFGRTPVVNKDAGRDHYPNVFSAAMAGGGVKGGRVIGSSDSKGAFPRSNPKSPQDVLATIYRHLGVDPHATYLDAVGRPAPVLPFGRPVDELF